MLLPELRAVKGLPSRACCPGGAACTPSSSGSVPLLRKRSGLSPCSACLLEHYSSTPSTGSECREVSLISMVTDAAQSGDVSLWGDLVRGYAPSLRPQTQGSIMQGTCNSTLRTPELRPVPPRAHTVLMTRAPGGRGLGLLGG